MFTEVTNVFAKTLLPLMLVVLFISETRVRADTVFVTGAAGFVGSSLIKTLFRQRRVAVGLVRKPSQMQTVRNSGWTKSSRLAANGCKEST
jgi:FlaA1/EpsC-like NDP-sugar epimerase